MNLYTINKEIQRIVELASDASDDETVHLMSEMDELQGDLTDKLQSLAEYITTLQGESDFLGGECRRIKEKQEKTEKKIDGIKNYISKSLQTAGIEKIKAGTFDLSFRTSESVHVIDDNIISSDYKNTKEIITINKMKIKEDIKAGKIVQGAVISHNKNLHIK